MRCDECKFWIKGQNGKKLQRDDVEGECHRNAPMPFTGDVHYETMKFLVLIYSTLDKDAAPVEFSQWEECERAVCWWPSTAGSSWCGEWKSVE